MNALATASGVISVALALYCSVPYWKSIVSGRTKPHQFSWLVFTLMNGIVTTSQFLEGGRASVLISFTFFIASAINYVLSFRYGVRDTSRFDRVLFGFSLFTIVVWMLTKDNAVAIWLTVIIDVCATTMIVLKIRNHPSSEAIVPWSIGTAAFVFSCLSLAGTPVGILYVRPIYGLLSDLAIVIPLAFFLHKASKARPNSSESDLALLETPKG